MDASKAHLVGPSYKKSEQDERSKVFKSLQIAYLFDWATIRALRGGCGDTIGTVAGVTVLPLDGGRPRGAKPSDLPPAATHHTHIIRQSTAAERLLELRHPRSTIPPLAIGRRLRTMREGGGATYLDRHLLTVR